MSLLDQWALLELTYLHNNKSKNTANPKHIKDPHIPGKRSCVIHLNDIQGGS